MKNGNNWLKWDLHIHTPDTLFNNQYKGSNREKVWDEYISKLEASNLDVIGINDYYSILGFKKVLEYKKRGRLKNIKEIFPSIEVRLSTSANDNRFVNYHIIFDPKVVEKIDKFFLKKLTFKYSDIIYNFNDEELITLGKKFKSNLSEEAAYKEGVNQFKVDLDQVSELLSNDIFKGNYFTIVAGDNDDGVNTLIKESQGWATRNNILLRSDGIYSTNERTINIFLKKGNKAEVEFVSNELGGLKPCFESSDAHKIEDIGKKWTWVKSEPSFSGLLQTKFESSKRVREEKYSKTVPTELPSNQWIKSITMENDKSNFIQKNIEFNSGLNAIIGGKSSGKSLLLYQLAKATNLENVAIKNFSYLNYDELKIKSSVKLANGNECNNDFHVEYFPQLYINKISENYENEELQKIIKECLKSKDDIINDINNFSNSKRILENNLESVIEKYILYRNSCEEKNEKIKKLGKRKDLEKNIKENEFRYKELEKEVTINSTEKEKYDEYQNKYMELNNLNQKIEEKISVIQSDLNQLIELKEKIKLDFDNGIENPSLKKKLGKSFNAFIEALDDEIKNENTEVSDLKDKRESNQEELKELKESIKPIEDKQSRLMELSKFKKANANISKKIKELESENKKLDDLEKKRLRIKDSISDLVINFSKNAKKIQNNLNDSELLTGIKINTKVIFDTEWYEESVISKFDGRKLNLAYEKGLPIADREIDFDTFINIWPEFIIGVLDKRYEDLLKDKFKNSNYDILTKELINVPLKMPINLCKDGDDLSNMSPGKRAVVILELLLKGQDDDLSPILLDQPEDNLDNRSISTELVSLLREVSKKRQVFIVTHNANLVVLTDADEIIVANQDPEINENENYRFEYISGSLENSIGTSDDKNKLSSKSIREDITNILEGGLDAFKLREQKYLLNY